MRRCREAPEKKTIHRHLVKTKFTSSPQNEHKHSQRDDGQSNLSRVKTDVSELMLQLQKMDKLGPVWTALRRLKKTRREGLTKTFMDVNLQQEEEALMKKAIELVPAALKVDAAGGEGEPPAAGAPHGADAAEERSLW